MNFESLLNEKLAPVFEKLPDGAAARRFFLQLAENKPSEAAKLLRDEGLTADLAAIAAWSPLLAATILQNPVYISWLKRRRNESSVSSKEDFLESLARFGATNSQIELNVLLARFRRRELLRIYLKDIRDLVTVAEITEELSNLADAILEFALRTAQQELENRFGAAFETDEKGKARRSEFCVISLGKLGSRELNYSSDIDLLFIYSADGATTGSRKSLTNREYFVKLAERTAKIVGEAAGEGAAFRVDLRLRPHGKVGSLAVSLKEAVGYYAEKSQAWERQTLIRARASAGNTALFRAFYKKIENVIYQKNVSVGEALANVRQSKQKIDREHGGGAGFNVKLGAGGIREIEFIAQALQLAHGGKDVWLRAPHTLISLSRITDRRFLSETELNELSDAYKFLRKLEHRLQMEHGLQTHIVPQDDEKRRVVALRSGCPTLKDFDGELEKHTTRVSKIFHKIFHQNAAQIAENAETAANLPESEAELNLAAETLAFRDAPASVEQRNVANLFASVEKSAEVSKVKKSQLTAARKLSEISNYFGEMLAANPKLIASLPKAGEKFASPDYRAEFAAAVSSCGTLHGEMAALRTVWSRFFIRLAAFDAFGKLSMRESNVEQTALAEVALETAWLIAQRELERRYGKPSNELIGGIIGLGRIAGRGMDYGSDLDIFLVYDDDAPTAFPKLTHAEIFQKTAEILTNALSSLMREGFLYRVDWRLRPDGKNGAAAISAKSFLHYMQSRAAIWEWLAYVKMRAVAGHAAFSEKLTDEAQNLLVKLGTETASEALRVETRRVRSQLEQTKKPPRGEFDIKHGAGGLLDIYFAVRFLQLRDGIKEQGAHRTTADILENLFEKGSLDAEDFEILSSGYRFLRRLDHELRLINGRSTRLPNVSHSLTAKVAARLNLDGASELLSTLVLHSIEIRRVFEKLLH